MIVSAIIRSIIRDRSQTWLLTLGLLITVASVVLLASASQTIVAQAQQDLSTYWRTTYDILVRPNGSVSDIEEKYGLVEANHLSGMGGGITFEQYEVIKSIPGIEVAAPIAVIGYLPQALYTEEVGKIEASGAYVIEQYEVNEDGNRIFPGDDNVKRHFYYSGEAAQSSRSPNAPITEYGRLGGFVVFPILLAAIDPEQRARELLAELGLSERVNHLPGQLSGGEQQRVSIARALINQPMLILADEPTGNLDSANSAGIIELLKSLNQKLNITIVMVTHDEALASQASRRIRMADGRIVD